jgi:hypothetical protein
VTLDWSELLREIAHALGEPDAQNPDVRTPCSQERLGQALQVPRGTLRNWLDGSEPRFSDGDRILAAWCQLTGKGAGFAPKHRAPLSARQRDAVAGFRPAGAFTIGADHSPTLLGAPTMSRSATMTARTPGAVGQPVQAQEPQLPEGAADDGLDSGTEADDLDALRQKLAEQEAEQTNKRSWLGVVMTNQPRKDWGLTIATLAELRARGHRVKLWAHTDRKNHNFCVNHLTIC